MNYFRAFIAGLVVPSIILPFGLTALYLLGKQQVTTNPYIHFLPLVWGIWNVLYFLVFKWILYVVRVDFRMYFVGGLLGLLVAVAAIFWFDLPSVMGMQHYLRYAPLVAAPVIYAIIWRFLVKPLNEMLGLTN
jgi:hypothetical protein